MSKNAVLLYQLKFFLVVLILTAFISCTQKQNAQPEEQVAVSDKDNITDHFKLMPDGKLWLTKNLNTAYSDSFCQKDSAHYCEQYGRLYTWKSAVEACSTLGNGWRLPSNEEWQSMAKHYGGVYDDSEDEGRSAYDNLLADASVGFNALLGGNREADGSYERLGAHGFYWTSSEYDSANAWFYNFGKGSNLLNHHTGDKRRAVSVRCVKDPD